MDFSTKVAVLVFASIIAGVVVVMAADDLTDVWNAITGVQEDVEDLGQDVEKFELLQQIYELETRVAILENCGQCEQGPEGPAGPPGPEGPQGPEGSWGAPDYDSGWITRPTFGDGLHYLSEQVDHNLGTKDLFVYMVGKTADGDVHQSAYGRMHSPVSGDRGAFWQTDGLNSIEIYFGSYGDYEGWMWSDLRVLIWVLP